MVRHALPVLDRCEVCGLAQEHPRGHGTARVIAASPAMQAVLVRAARFARSDAALVIFGESGTGKEVVARAVHASGPRHDKPFVAVNVAALPSELLETELFGHARGAFTGAATARAGLFEEAAGGTLFLDEIAEMPLALQAKLLRALQDGEVRRVGESRSFAVDARIVGATHRDLRAEVRAGRFREDLYFRLKVLSLRVPALRERREDILPLVAHFLADLGPTASGRMRTLDKAARDTLLRAPWPGNVRELQNAILHGAALAEGDVLGVQDLPEDLLGDVALGGGARADASDVTAIATLADVERAHVHKALEACGGAVGLAARALGISRNTLWRKLKSDG